MLLSTSIKFLSTVFATYVKKKLKELERCYVLKRTVEGIT
jgi:hypothetical protein